MAYTVQTPVTDDVTVLNAAYMAAFEENLRVLHSGNDQYCKLYLSANQSIPNVTDTVLSWGAAAFQQGSIWSLAAPTKLFAPVDGLYLVIPNTEWRTSSINFRGSMLFRNAGGAAKYTLQSQGAVGGKSNLSAPTVIKMSAGQWLTVGAFQGSGASLQVHGGTEDRTRVSMLLLGGDGAAGSWVDPVDWVLNTTPTKAQLDQALINNVASLRNLNDNFLRVHRTSVQSLPNNARTAISWQAQSAQTGITWSSGTNPTRMTVTVTGTYLLATNIMFANVTGTRRGCGYRISRDLSTNYDLQFHSGNGFDACTAIDFIDLVAGEYIEVYGFQNTGGAINTADTGEGASWAFLSLWATGPGKTPRWTPARTWADGFPSGTFMSPALFNTVARDNPLNIRNGKGQLAMAWMDDDQSISQGKRDPITYAKNTRNIGGIWEGQKFTATVDGVFLVTNNAEWGDDSDATSWGNGLRVNEASTAHDMQFQMGDTNGGNQSAGDLIKLRRGDSLVFYAYQDGTESATLHGGAIDRSRGTCALVAAL